MRGCKFKLLQGRFRLEIRENFFTAWMVEHWDGLPREMVESLSLVVLKKWLEMALCAMACLIQYCHRVNLMIVEVFFKLNDSMIP